MGTAASQSQLSAVHTTTRPQRLPLIQTRLHVQWLAVSTIVGNKPPRNADQVSRSGLGVSNRNYRQYEDLNQYWDFRKYRAAIAPPGPLLFRLPRYRLDVDVRGYGSSTGTGSCTGTLVSLPVLRQLWFWSRHNAQTSTELAGSHSSEAPESRSFGTIKAGQLRLVQHRCWQLLRVSTGRILNGKRVENSEHLCFCFQN